MDTLSAAAAGFGLGLSLIIAIGAQNAYVLRQGIRGEHVGAIVLICAASDAVLIAAGISGVGFVIEGAPGIITAIRIVGATFLITYGVMAARRALNPQTLTAETAGGASFNKAMLTAFALTWLNPHVYLDTVLLLGSVANTHDGDRWAFGAGAAIGSVAWFSTLGFGARLLRGIFARPLAWRILDAMVAVVMIALGAMLIAQS